VFGGAQVASALTLSGSSAAASFAVIRSGFSPASTYVCVCMYIVIYMYI
jgi:hypothetical protein